MNISYKMSKIQDRIKEYIDTKGISVREFCRKINVSSSFLSRDAEISSDKVLNIINAYPEISIEWLMTGIGNMYRQNDNKNTGEEVASIELYRDLRKQNEDLMEMLKQSQKQLDDMIQIAKKLSSDAIRGNGALPENDVGCAGAG